MTFPLKSILGSYNIGRAAKRKSLPTHILIEINYKDLLNKLAKDGKISSKDLKFLLKGAKNVL